MNKNIKTRHLPLDLKIDYESNLVYGDVIQILDDKGEIQDYAYLNSDVKISYGVAFVNVTSQKTGKNIEIVVTDAIKKI
jgi:acyl-ACP thioesterase